jgi:hypothetical protein
MNDAVNQTPTDTLTGLLETFARADACWYSSVRPNGRVHLAPIWFVWYAGAAWVVTQRSAVRAHNLLHNSSVSLALPDPMNALILEGTAAEAPGALDDIRPIFQAKYDWDIAADQDYTFIIRVQPVKLLAWGSYGEGRWRWEDGGWRKD